MRRLTLVTLLALAVLALAVGCQKQTAGPKATDYRAARAVAIAKAKQAAASSAKLPPGAKAVAKNDEGSSDQTAYGTKGQGYVYDRQGKKDPFRSFILDRVQEVDPLAKGPLEQFDLSQLSVTGVVWEGHRRRAFVVDPAGHGYIVREGDPIGKNAGHVVEIGDNRMLVREAYVDFQGEKTTKEIQLRIRQSQGG